MSPPVYSLLEVNADELKKCIAQHPKNQSQIAEDIGVTRATISRWINGSRTIGAPDLKLLRLYFYGEIPFEDVRPTQDLSSILKFSPSEWRIIEILARRSGMTAGQWIGEQVRTIIAFRASEVEEPAPEPNNITPLRRRQSAHLMAAAGSPITAEVLEEMDDSGIIRVQIAGLSMEPLLHDGDIIEMRHKSKARSHFMKKGLIYLVEVEGGYAVKRYNTRPAREDEKDAEYLTPTGSVGVLESINPDFEPIDIKCPVEWVAWLEHAD